jgi:D-alanine transfer protein
MKSRHLVAALIALGIMGAALVAGTGYATHLEQAYVHALAPVHLPINLIGIALDKAAFQQNDLLVIYGASETLDQPSEFQADQLFKNYPTGFAPYEIAAGGSDSLLHAESLAAIGTDLHGKKVVISLTPSQMSNKMHEDVYFGLFSRLHGNELAFSSLLSYPTRQWAARRMLLHPNSLQKDPILLFALEQLANDTPLSHLLYALVYPLGKLQTLILELQDHFATVTYIITHKDLTPDVLRQPTAVDWKAELAKAQQEQAQTITNNPYAFDNNWWGRNSFKITTKPVPQGDTEFLSLLDGSPEWEDTSLMLQIVKELGGHPLLLGRPIYVKYYHAIGISDAAIKHYYDKLDGLAKQYSVPVVDFRNVQDDIHFTADRDGHTSREGWVYVDQTLDAFYHQSAP